MKFLFPKQTNFLDHYRELGGCIKNMSDLFSEFARKFDDPQKYYLKAEKIEHKADDITRDIVNELNRTFIAPFDREDMYAMAYEIDEIVDLIENVIHNIYLFDIKEKEASLEKFSNLIVAACENLDKLIAECFKNKVNEKNIEIWMNKIQKLEDEGDEVFKSALGRIFAKGNDPLEAVKWKDIVEDLEEVMDQFKKVSGIIVRVMVKFC